MSDGVSAESTLTTPPGRRKRNKRGRRARRKRFWLGVAIAAALVLLTVMVVTAARRDPPRGQVVARVGTEDLTVSDLQAEARAEGEDYSDETAPGLAKAVVARALLARSARELGLDHSPTFPADRRRAEAQVLAEQVTRGLAKRDPVSPAAIEAYEAAHPDAFRQRRRVTVEEVRYRPQPGEAVYALQPSLEALRLELKRQGRPFEEASDVLDSASAPPPLLKAVESASGLVVRREGDLLTAYQLTGSNPTPPGPAEAEALARSALVKAGRRAALDARLQQLRAQTSVDYQSGVWRTPLQPTGEAH